MGYNTDFAGELKFSKELTASQLVKIKQFLGIDVRFFVDLSKLYPNLTHVDLKLLDDFSGVEWNGSENTYYMVESVNMIIEQMRMEIKDFSFTGELIAQGEDFDDRWKLIIKDGIAEKVDIIITGHKVQCPHCDEYFILE